MARTKSTLVPLIVLYFVSSSSLLVLNKLAIMAVPNASLLLLIQLSSTAAIVSMPSLIGKTRINFKPNVAFIRAYSSVAGLFLATIYSNFQVIHSIGINPFIVLRCSTPLMVSMLDWVFMGRSLPDWKSTLALLGILACGSAYANLKASDPNFLVQPRASNSMHWCVLWLISFLLDMVYIKHIVEVYPCSVSERTLYQNFLALPFLIFLLAIGVEDTDIMQAKNAPKSAYIAVLLTCVAGAVLSFTGMSLRKELSATLFTVLGIVCKMASMLLNELFVEPEKDSARLLCVGAVIVCSSFYKQAPLKSRASVTTVEET